MKKTIALLLAALMIVGILPAAFAAPGTDVSFTVEADKSTALLNEEVTFSVYIETAIPFTAFQFDLAAPAGMEYVANSGKIPDGLKAQMGFAEASFTELTRRATFGNDTPYTASGKLKVAEFKCKVTAPSASGYAVSVNNIDVTDANFDSLTYNVVDAAVSVRVPATGVTLDHNTLSLDTGANNTATLVATVSPDACTDKTVSWKSNNDAVATINNGTVTALKHGTATITVTTVDGGFTDTCVVTVTCAHTAKTPTTAKTANCQEGGWDAYYTCDACGQLFAADGTTKIDAIPTTVKDGNNHTNIQDFVKDPATCTYQGHDAYSKCMACGVVTSGSDAKYFGDHNYGTLISATPEKHTPTELKPAVAAHYQCSVCQKYFTASKVETTLSALTGATPSHSHGNWVTTDADQHWKECSCGDKIQVGAHDYDNTCDTACNTCGHVRTITHTWSTTWSTDGTKHWKECTVCHNAKNEEGNHTGGTATCQAKKECSVCHLTYGDFAPCNFVETVASKYLVSAATCNAKAVYKKSCSVCGTAHATEKFETGSKDADNHVGGAEIKDAATENCTTNGYTGDTWCKGCNTKIGNGTDIPAKHKLQKNAANPASHTAPGNKEYYTCSVCGKYFSDAEGKNEIELSSTVIPQDEHNYGTVLKSDDAKHWKECSCGDKIEIADHTFGEWTVTKEATTAEKGEKAKECSVCSHKITEEIPEVAPQTGDASNLILWAMLATVSFASLVSLVVYKKKFSA